MNVQVKRQELLNWLAQVVDKDILKSIEELKDRSGDEPLKVSVSQEVQQAINKGLEDKKAGRVRDHEVVMTEVRAKYQQA